MANIFDIDLPAGIENVQRQRFRDLLADTMRPTAAEQDLMIRAWIERLGALAGQAVGVTGTEVYIPLAVMEIAEGATPPADMDAAKATAVDTIVNRMPDATDIHAVAVDVLGETLANSLGL